MSDTEMIANFIARNGVTKCAAGVASMSWRDMRSAVRGEKSENDLINERHVVGDHVRNGLGEWIA
jgi:hypothetical protein